MFLFLNIYSNNKTIKTTRPVDKSAEMYLLKWYILFKLRTRKALNRHIRERMRSRTIYLKEGRRKTLVHFSLINTFKRLRVEVIRPLLWRIKQSMHRSIYGFAVAFNQYRITFLRNQILKPSLNQIGWSKCLENVNLLFS